MKRRSMAVGVIILALAMAGCGSSTQQKSAQTGASSTAVPSNGSTTASTGTGGAPIKVGLICTCTGPLSVSSAAGEQVYKAWADSVNASGGINGHTVSIVSEDDTGVPGTSISDIQTLLSDHVTAIVDISLVDQAWAATVKAAQVPVVGGEPTETPFYTNSDFYPVGETIDALPYAFAATAKAGGATTMANFYCAEAAVCQETIAGITATGKKLGVPDVYNASIAATAPNYTAQCVAAQQAHAGAILNGDVDTVFKRVAEDCSRQGYHPVYVSSGEAYDVTMDTATGLKDNTWYESNDLPYFANDPEVTAMNNAVNKDFPGLVGKPNVWTGGTSISIWASGLLLEDAVKAGGLEASQTPTAAEIVRGLGTIQSNNLGGLAPPLTFTSGQPHPIDCWFTFRVQDGTPALANGGQTTCENQAG